MEVTVFHQSAIKLLLRRRRFHNGPATLTSTVIVVAPAFKFQLSNPLVTNLL